MSKAIIACFAVSFAVVFIGSTSTRSEIQWSPARITGSDGPNFAFTQSKSVSLVDSLHTGTTCNVDLFYPQAAAGNTGGIIRYQGRTVQPNCRPTDLAITQPSFARIINITVSDAINQWFYVDVVLERNFTGNLRSFVFTYTVGGQPYNQEGGCLRDFPQANPTVYLSANGGGGTIPFQQSPGCPAATVEVLAATPWVTASLNGNAISYTASPNVGAQAANRQATIRYGSGSQHNILIFIDQSIYSGDKQTVTSPASGKRKFHFRTRPSTWGVRG